MRDQVAVLLVSVLMISAYSASQEVKSSKPHQPAKSDSAQSQNISIEDTVKYINNLLDSGLGAKDDFYYTGHIIADRGTRTISWYRWENADVGNIYAFSFRSEMAIFRASAKDLGEVSIGKAPNIIHIHRENPPPEPVVILNCRAGTPCFAKLTHYCTPGECKYAFNIEQLAKNKVPDYPMNFEGKDTVKIEIFTTGDEETTARFVKALNYLIAQVSALPDKASNDPFAN